MFLEEHPDQLGKWLREDFLPCGLGPGDPTKLQVVFFGADLGWGLYFKDKAVLVPRLAGLEKEVFVDEEWATNLHGLSGLFNELAFERFRGGFSGLDVAAWEVPIVGILVFAEEYLAIADGDAAGEEFDFLGL